MTERHRCAAVSCRAPPMETNIMLRPLLRSLWFLLVLAARRGLTFLEQQPGQLVGLLAGGQSAGPPAVRCRGAPN